MSPRVTFKEGTVSDGKPHRRLVITVDVRDVTEHFIGHPGELWWAREERVIDLDMTTNPAEVVRAAVDAAAASVPDPA